MGKRTKKKDEDTQEEEDHDCPGRWRLAVEVGPVEQRQAARGVNDELLASEHHQPSYPATTAHRASGVSGNRVGVGPAASEAPTEPWFTGCGLRAAAADGTGVSRRPRRGPPVGGCLPPLVNNYPESRQAAAAQGAKGTFPARLAI